MDRQHVLGTAFRFDEDRNGDRTFRKQYVRFVLKDLHVVFSQAERGHETVIEKVEGRQIIVRRLQHGVVCYSQTNKKAHAKRDDGEDGKITSQGGLDCSEKRTDEHGHHSISSTGMTVSLTCWSTIVPLLTRMIRSAIAVSAELCVMMTTVMPLSRAVFCRIFRTDLPVT